MQKKKIKRNQSFIIYHPICSVPGHVIIFAERGDFPWLFLPNQPRTNQQASHVVVKLSPHVLEETYTVDEMKGSSYDVKLL